MIKNIFLCLVILKDLRNYNCKLFFLSATKIEGNTTKVLNYTYFYKNQIIWLNLSAPIVFLNFRLICSYFVLLTIIIFDLALHICIFIIHALYFWHVMAGLKEKFYILIIKFMYGTFCFLTEPQTMLQLKILWHRPYFIVKLLLSLCILFIHSSFVC